MKLLFGTSNPAKLQHMIEMLKGLDVEIIGLEDVEIDINVNVDESGDNPLENARIKAMTYYQATGIPTFSCDSGLYIQGLEDKEQPGVHVRRVNNKYLNDEEYIEYYADLISKFNNEPRAKFKNAICLIMNEEEVFEYDGEDIANHFRITSIVHPKRKIGFPMDSISLDIETGKYLVENGENSKNEKEITKGFREFFYRTSLK